MRTVLIVDDDRILLKGLRDAFAHEGFAVLAAEDGEAGLEQALAGRADLIVLDVVMPGLSGLEVCRRLRAQGVLTPVLMLTSMGEEGDVVRGLGLGADDYLTKPFSFRELVARARALLRRIDLDRGEVERARIGAAVVDFRRFAVSRGGIDFPLTEREAALLRLFLAAPREVILRQRVLEEIWRYDPEASTRTLDTFVYRLRRKIETDPENPRHLLTVRGAGYKFMP